MRDLQEIRIARVALAALTEPGNRAIHHLAATLGPVEALEVAMRGGLPDERSRRLTDARMTAGDPRRAAEEALAYGRRLGARLVVPEDEQWPRQLDDLTRLRLPSATKCTDEETAPPLCLWARGPRPVNEALDHSVAVVGSRAASPYGVHVAIELAHGLAERDWTVVSGGAYGIDAAAHRGALSAGGVTAAVLACGVERAYPASNTALFEHIAEAGLILSEWPPTSDPYPHRFLIRNRVIAAATRGTVMVEASARSGARQTLARALHLARRAMVVPGPVTSDTSVGCHEMLREHPEVRVVANAAHVLEEVGRIGDDLAPPARAPERPRDQLDDAATLVLEALPARGVAGVDTLAAKAGLDTRTALRKLSLLETLGFVIRRDGAYALARRR
jgi:DNA processing protein